MVKPTEEKADGLPSSAMQHTLVLDAKIPMLALSMHRLYHLVVAKSRISESRTAHSSLELRQKREEDELCEKIAGILSHGVPRAHLASAMDANPALTRGCKRIFRQWIDVAALRVANEECPAKVTRLVKGECNEESNGRD